MVKVKEHLDYRTSLFRVPERIVRALRELGLSLGFLEIDVPLVHNRNLSGQYRFCRTTPTRHLDKLLILMYLYHPVARCCSQRRCAAKVPLHLSQYNPVQCFESLLL